MAAMKQVNLRMPEETITLLDEQFRATGVPKSEVIRRAVHEFCTSGRGAAARRALAPRKPRKRAATA